jgi:diaminohydroxyphosphoribosylaminopyrimidine deaminase/5-amino-6-(5-phosphoribosylamino)uracil reductase
MDPAKADLPEHLWRRLLDGDAVDEPECDLYRPLLASPDAADGCLVLGRIAQSLDGRIATVAGASRWISGPEDIRHTHRLRALSDAILVGAGTVRADDPLLTTRAVAGPSPVRVVLDPDRRLGADRRVFAGGPPTLLLCAADALAAAPPPGRAELVGLPRGPDGIAIPAVLAALAARGLRRIFVEGGGLTVSRFLAAGALDRLHVTIAPLLLGSGIPAFTLPEARQPEDGLRLSWTVHRLGADLLLDIPLHRARPPVCGRPPP